MKISKCILGSGLIALLAKRILGSDWTIVPIGPSRFYSNGVPAFGDDFVMCDNAISNFIDTLGFDKNVLFYNRPFSSGGQLLYNGQFASGYMSRMGLEDTSLTKSLLKTTFSVYSFSCIQLWNKLLPEFIAEIRGFYKDSKIKKIHTIRDHRMIFNVDGSDVEVEYDEMVSTIPYHSLESCLGLQNTNRFGSLYYYLLDAPSLNIDKANQVLVCDEVIPFNRCTKINNRKFLLEVLDKYHDSPFDVFASVIGRDFEILKTNVINNGYPYPGSINDFVLSANDIIAVGSLAQSDPFMDVASCIKRLLKIAANGL